LLLAAISDVEWLPQALSKARIDAAAQGINFKGYSVKLGKRSDAYCDGG